MSIVTQDRIVLWIQPDGPGTPFIPFGIGEKSAGMTGKSISGAGRSPVYGRDQNGEPAVVQVNTEAPGDLPTGTISFYERAQIDVLQRALETGCPINIQTRIVKCGVLDNPVGWDVIDHWANGKVTSFNPGDGPSLGFSGESVSSEATVSFTDYVRMVQTSLAALTSGETHDLLAVAGLSDKNCKGCSSNGYVGADKILYVGVAAENLAQDGLVLYTKDGGGTISATSAAPFATTGNYEDVNFIVTRPISQTQFRIVVGTKSTVAGAKARIAYADVTYGDEGTTSWTIVEVANSVAGDVVTALDWLFFDRLYLASAGDIYVSTDQGETVASSPIYTGSTQINGFAKSPNGEYVYAFGASNLILREREQNGVFETRVGPGGGGDFYSMYVAGNGHILAGNGTGLYRSTDNAGNAGNWELLKDFGTNKKVVGIQVLKGDSVLTDAQLLRVVVDDVAGGNGAVWQSVDGGATFSKITELANTGYNGAYWSKTDNNLAFVVGDAGAIHKLTPQ